MEQIRPFPPTDLIDQAEEEEAIRLAPAVELKEWVIKNYLTIGGQLHNPDHDHISELLHDDETFLAFAWASSACQSKKRMVLGQCEKVMFNQGGWKKARQEQQMRDWFGCVPVYLITIDASFCEQASDHDFCALIEHELYHIGVERDQDDEIMYSDNTGLPKHYLAGHDVEEFTGVVRRYGANQEVQEMVNAANQRPTVAKADVYHACGTCFLRVV